MKRIFKPNKLRILSEFIIRTAFLYTIISLFLYITPIILMMLMEGFNAEFRWIYILKRFPIPLVASIAIVAAYMLSRMTTIQVDNQNVAIKQGFKKNFVFSLDNSSIHVNEKTSTFSSFEYYNYFLNIIDEQGIATTISLPFFSKECYSDILSYLNNLRVEAVPITTRNEVLLDDIRSGVLFFEVPREKIIRDAWYYFLKIFVVMIVSLIALILFNLFSWNGGGGFKYYLAVACGIVMIPSGIIYALVLQKKQNHCPRTIKRNGDFLSFDDDTFSARSIDKVTMTHPNSYKTSIGSNHRYITFFVDGKKYRYWFGIYSSLPIQQYKSLCEGIEQAFLLFPSKIIYKK